MKKNIAIIQSLFFPLDFIYYFYTLFLKFLYYSYFYLNTLFSYLDEHCP